MAITINAAAQNLAGDAIVNALEGETINLYGGTPPANAKAAQSNPVIAAGVLPTFDPHAGDAGAEIAAEFDVTGTAAAAAGTAATHYRAIVAGTGEVIQGTVGGTGSGADLILDNVSIAEDQVVTVSSFNYVIPDGS